MSVPLFDGNKNLEKLTRTSPEKHSKELNEKRRTSVPEKRIN